MKKRCIICKKEFTATRKWSKYCSEKCKNRGKIRNAIQWRKKHDPLKVKTTEELKKEPYKTNYENIMMALGGPEPIFEDLFSGEYIEKYLKRHEKQRGKVTWSYILKKTSLSQDTLHRYVIVMRKLGILKEKGYVLSEKHKFEPLKIWYTDLIMDCSLHHILNYGKFTFFYPNLSLNKEEKGELKGLMNGGMVSYPYLITFFRKVGLRVAGEIWSRFVNKIEASPATKFYFWLKIIYIHYLASLKPFMIIEGEGDYRQEEILPIRMEIFMTLKKMHFEGLPVELPPFKELHEWQPQFKKLLESVLKRKYSFFEEDEVSKYEKQFKKVCEITLIERVKSDYFIVVVRPEILSYFYLKDVEGIEKEKAHYISEASEDAYEPSLFHRDIISDKPEAFPYAVDELFKGLDSGIIALGYKDKKELYDELQHLIDAFELPS